MNQTTENTGQAVSIKTHCPWELETLVDVLSARYGKVTSVDAVDHALRMAVHYETDADSFLLRHFVGRARKTYIRKTATAYVPDPSQADMFGPDNR